MKVWIDQDLCTGDGLCEEIAPAVFTLLDDGLAYVKEGDREAKTNVPFSTGTCPSPSVTPAPTSSTAVCLQTSDLSD